MIKLEHVSKTFGAGDSSVEAVQDVSLHIRPGEIYGIIGYSGAGKSTLVRCMNLLETPTEGRVIVGGRELTALPHKELLTARQSIGMIFQQFNLLPSRTVAENVAFPLRNAGLAKDALDERVMELLKLVGISDKKDAYPSQLSGGQKQRVAIARALAADPKVLLCDEATSALDPQTTLSILLLLKQIHKETGITIVIITHEMAVVKEICSRVAVMDGGRVVEEGEVYKVFSDPQQPITRSFIASTSNLSRVDALLAEHAEVVKLSPGQVLVRLSYIEQTASVPVISAISRDFGVDVNILFSNLELIGGAPLGGLVAILSGGQISEAVSWLCERNVKVEVLEDARISQ